jgi:hypothetical protein
LRGSDQSTASRLVSDATQGHSHVEKRTVRDHGDVFVQARSVKSYAQEVQEHQHTASSKLRMRWARSTQAPPYGSAAGQGIDLDPPHIDIKSQKLVVTELYPRLLYTFSDVVCYITTNPK